MARQGSIKAVLRRAGAYRRVFSTPDGEIVFNDLAKYCANAGLHVPGDPYSSHFNLGKLRVLQRIAGFMRMNPRQMLDRAQERAIDGDEEE